MTEQTPTPPPPPPPTPTQSAVPPPPAPPAPPAQDAQDGGSRRGGGRRKAIIGGLAAALVLGGGYGAYAVYDQLDGGGAQPHDVLPASSEVYFRVDLDPSAGQKVDLFKLIRKVPDLADEIGVKSEGADIRELVFPEILASECEDVDYEKDVEPWLGDRIGVGASVTDETFIIAVQTTDEGAARDGIKKLFQCADDEYGIAFLDGYAILAPEQDDVDQAVKEAQESPLGENKTFVDDFEQLGNPGVASGWADIEAIAKAPAVADSLGAEKDELAKAGSAAMTLRADGSAIELAVLSGQTTASTTKAAPLADLPADTVAALSIPGVGDQITEGFDSLVEEFDSQFSGAFDTPTAISPASVTPEPTDGLGLDDDPEVEELTPLPADPGFGSPSTSAQSFIDQIEQETGLRLPEDLQTLFGDGLTLAIGGENLETIPTLSGPDGFEALDIALALTSDEDAALDLLQRLAQLASQAGIPLVASPTDDGAVLATNQGAADAIAEPDGSLGDEKAFRSVIPDGNSAQGGFYLDIGTILDKVLEADPPADVRDSIESASKLSAVGVSSSEHSDDRSLTRVRVSFD